MSMVGRAIMGTAGAAPAFAYDDIPNQLLRIDAAQGFTLSGTNITAIADQSSAAETITITGTPQYTANDANLNNQPSFIPVSGTITVPGLNHANVNFFAAVIYKDGDYRYVFDETSGSVCNAMFNGPDKFMVNATNLTTGLGSTSFVARILSPIDGSTATTLRGASIGTVAANTSTGTNITIGQRADLAAATRSRVGFLMICSAVPSAPLRASLEANLLARFG